MDRTEAGNVSEFSFRGHKPALDGLRGIAIVMVLFIHFYQKPWIESNHPTFTLFFGRLVTPGAYGVELFFVLSGMLITGILLDSRDRARSLKSFYMRRLLRIFPLYYGALFVLFAILPHLISFDDGARAVAAKQGWLWAHLANVPTAGVVWDESSLFWVGHFWSLAVEEHFYFLWPWIVFALPKRSCFGACVGLLLVGLGGRSVLALRADLAPELLRWSTLLKIDGLAVGSMIAIALREPRLSGLIPVGRAFLLSLSGAGVLFLTLVFLPRKLRGATVSILEETIVVVFFGLVLLSCLRMKEGEFVHSVFTSRFLVSFGKYSYGIYVIHGLMRPVFTRCFDLRGLFSLMNSPIVPFLIYYVLAICSSFALAFLSYNLYERHWLSLKSFFTY